MMIYSWVRCFFWECGRLSERANLITINNMIECLPAKEHLLQVIGHFFLNVVDLWLLGSKSMQPFVNFVRSDGKIMCWTFFSMQNADFILRWWKFTEFLFQGSNFSGFQPFGVSILQGSNTPTSTHIFGHRDHLGSRCIFEQHWPMSTFACKCWVHRVFLFALTIYL